MKILLPAIILLNTADSVISHVLFDLGLAREVNPFLKFLSYFWGPIPWMIEIAAVLSAVARHWSELAIILVLLVANAVNIDDTDERVDEAWRGAVERLDRAIRVARRVDSGVLSVNTNSSVYQEIPFGGDALLTQQDLQSNQDTLDVALPV